MGMIEDLQALMSDPDKEVRWFDALQLKNCGDISAIESLIHALMDDDEGVVDRTAFALERIYEKKGGYDLVRHLLYAEEHADDRVRDKVKSILTKKIRIEPEANE